MCLSMYLRGLLFMRVERVTAMRRKEHEKGKTKKEKEREYGKREGEREG